VSTKYLLSLERIGAGEEGVTRSGLNTPDPVPRPGPVPDSDLGGVFWPIATSWTQKEHLDQVCDEDQNQEGGRGSGGVRELGQALTSCRPLTSSSR